MKRIILSLIAGLLTSFLTARELPRVKPNQVGLDPTLLGQVDPIIQQAIARQEIPGAVLAVVKDGKMAYLKAYGFKQTTPQKEPMTVHTIFDMASCTKPMATAMCILKLCEQGLVDVSDPVSQYLPEFKTEKGPVLCIHHLLTHTSGFPAYVAPSTLEKQYGEASPETLRRFISHSKRTSTPGSSFNYSCLNYITLQYIIQSVTGLSLRDFAKQVLFQPLGMAHTDFFPDGEHPRRWDRLIAPTTVYKDGSMLKGQVHDPLARIANHGVSGNAGLFSCAEDIALFCAMLQNHGEWDGVKLFSPQTVQMMRTARAFGRTYGWDVSSPYSSCNGKLFSDQTYGHTGFTGTSIVIDPVNNCSVILLSNAVHPQEGKSNMIRLRAKISDTVAAAIIR